MRTRSLALPGADDVERMVNEIAATGSCTWQSAFVGIEHRDRGMTEKRDKMLARGVSREEIESVLADNEIAESYEQEGRERYVLLAQPRGRPLHVVVAEDDVIDVTVVLSVYEPDEAHGWDPVTGFRMRKEAGP